ncbi:hypothetical protein [Pseudochelatococcus sp. G4_1912]|uniref:hypothetical protein n=1 Tax=Pseudochelatococcus sp. G4_1912 TaxID=3114288 RepID=UPI0039C71B76
MTRVDLKKAGVLVSVVATTLLISAAGTRAQDSDTSGVFMKDVLGKLGIIEGEAPRIDYRERAPLVLPPNGALPAPRTGAAKAESHPNWPTDPDVAARQKAIDAANAPVPNNRDKEAARVLSPDEIRSGRRAGGGGAHEANSDACHGDACSARPVNPRQLRGDAPRREPPLVHGQEPARSALTQPPTGYRVPAGNAPLPDAKEAPVVREDAASPYQFLNRNN